MVVFEPERLVPSAQGEALGFRWPIEATLKGSFTGVARTPRTALSGPNRFADPRSQAFGLGWPTRPFRPKPTLGESHAAIAGQGLPARRFLDQEPRAAVGGPMA